MENLTRKRKEGYHFVDRNKMIRKFAEKGVFLYTPFRETCYNGNAETESCQVSFSLRCGAAFFSPCRGNPALTQHREWAQASASVRFRQLRRNPISFKLNMPRCGIAGREIENRKVLQGAVHLMRYSLFFLGSYQKKLICDKLEGECEG